MKKMKRIYQLCIGLCFLFIACEKDDIMRFDTQTGINFMQINKAFSVQYSFIVNPEASYIQEIPVAIAGDSSAADRIFQVEVVKDSLTTASPDQYVILEGRVEAGKFEGVLPVQLNKSEALDNETVSLKLRLVPSEDFILGNIESRTFVVRWTNQVIVPTWSVYYRTYFTSVGSTAAFRIFIETTGMTQFLASDYAALGVAGVEALATKFGDYIKQWNLDHPEDILVHDDGAAKGEPIEPIYYTHSKYD